MRPTEGHDRLPRSDRAGKAWLGDEDSNLDSQIQSLLSYL